MINLNGVYFDKVRTARVIKECDVERDLWGFATSIHVYFDVEVNGESLGLELDADEAEKYIRRHIK